MFFDRCDRCQKGDDEIFRKGWRYPERVMLAGDFRALLCRLCVNDWTQRTRCDGDFLEYSAALVQQRCAIAGDRLIDATNLDGRILALKQLLFAKAEQFIAEDVTREEPVL